MENKNFLALDKVISGICTKVILKIVRFVSQAKRTLLFNA
jgi:hypothetical protein